MTDAGNAIQIDIQSAEISCFEQANGSIRFNLGYIMGKFSKIITSQDLYVRIWYKRGLDMNWESIQYKLNSGRTVFKQKLPAGLTVAMFYVQLYGWIAPETGNPTSETAFELTDFEISVKNIPVGKFAGEPLGLSGVSEPPPPPQIEPFEMYLDMIGEVQATQARAVWFTTHEATTKVIYGLSPTEMYNIIEDLTFTQYHSIILPNLEVNKLYYAQFYSTSKITGETIYSDVKSFVTGAELVLTDFLDKPATNFTELDIDTVSMHNDFGTTDYLLTLLPDAFGEIINGFSSASLDKNSLTAVNIIGNEYSTSVS